MQVEEEEIEKKKKINQTVLKLLRKAFLVERTDPLSSHWGWCIAKNMMLDISPRL